MKESIVFGENLPIAYHRALHVLNEQGEIADCDDWDQKQKELSMTIVVENPLSEPMISKLFIGGPRELEQYRQEMLDGILDFEIKKGNWVYTYHDRMVNYPYENTLNDKKNKLDLRRYMTIKENPGKIKYSLNQIYFVIDELKRNPSSRRAVILVRDPSVDIDSNDPACLQHIQYFIRKNKLYCKVLFRSNDACKATFMNAFALIKLQERIANELGIEIGTYTHRANSFHCYEKDFELLEGYCKRIENEDLEDLTYDYVDDWKELMEEYQPEIKKMVEELKNHGTK